MGTVGWKDSVEIIGIVSVVASLVFVALEVRQNTYAVRSAAFQDFSNQSYQSGVLFVENPDLRAAFLAMESGQLTDDQRLIVRAYYTSILRIAENRFRQVQLGIYGEEMHSYFGARSAIYRQPYFETYWTSTKHTFSADFQEYVEAYLIPLATDSVIPNQKSLDSIN